MGLSENTVPLKSSFSLKNFKIAIYFQRNLLIDDFQADKGLDDAIAPLVDDLLGKMAAKDHPMENRVIL